MESHEIPEVYQDCYTYYKSCHPQGYCNHLPFLWRSFLFLPLALVCQARYQKHDSHGKKRVEYLPVK